ncbi:patatin-like phospholipase family protein [Salirhabdus sp. Marseille-P4669]|uniref:patatin-like phospholipase family protein n=1 Tax=Salirhabdus sp. Marseille-P4669 TaxID=2042310 RepID=UPI000C798739|nr:patatin-like phospholipase family protein [Salirhabdus sp. Marseille-P4669]
MAIGIALAGGAVPKFAAIGVLQALEEHHIEISHIAGTSSGAIIAGLYAYGYSVEDIKYALLSFGQKHIDVNWYGVLRRFCFLRKNVDGCVKGDRLESLIKRLVGTESVSSFQIPCGLMATDLRKGKPVVFTNVDPSSPNLLIEKEIPICKAIRASSAIPVMYKPVRWKDYVLVDGGLVDNCPVHLVRELGANKVIRIDPLTYFKEDDPYHDISVILNRSMSLTLENQMEEEKQEADLNLYPVVGNVGLFEYDKIAQCIELGYQFAFKEMANILTVADK